MNEIKMVTWNIENFVKLDEMMKSHKLITSLNNADLIFFQEWKLIEGLSLINKLNEQINKTSDKFNCITVDRCC